MSVGHADGSAAMKRTCASPLSTWRTNGNVSPPKFDAAADAADHDVGLLAGHLHLGDRLLPDHGLVKQHVVQDRTERVVGVLTRRRDLDGL